MCTDRSKLLRNTEGSHSALIEAVHNVDATEHAGRSTPDLERHIPVALVSMAWGDRCDKLIPSVTLAILVLGYPIGGSFTIE